MAEKSLGCGLEEVRAKVSCLRNLDPERGTLPWILMWLLEVLSAGTVEVAIQKACRFRDLDVECWALPLISMWLLEEVLSFGIVEVAI